MVSDIAPPSGRLSGAALRDAKRALRERIVAWRDAQDANERDVASQAIAQRILAVRSFASSRCVLMTLPFRSEWNTRPLVDAALARNAIVALPRVDTSTRMLELHRVTDLARDVAPGYRGIVEPLESLPRIAIADVDWVLVPGVAFDEHGRRLGYGGGYYDRLLVSLPPHVPKIAGAFDGQIVETIPHAPHDLAVDAIATPTRLIEAA